MGKQRKWQFLLILAVTVLTVYNILPTLFYYLQPLKQPISGPQAQKIGVSIADRLHSLEQETIEWVQSYCNLIRAKPLKISLDPKNPQEIRVSFAKTEEAHRLRAQLPRAGSLIPFAPGQLTLGVEDENEKCVHILRKVPAYLEADDLNYFAKNDPQILEKRMHNIRAALTDRSDTAFYLDQLLQGKTSFAILETLAAHINAIATIDGPVQQRFLSWLTHGMKGNPASAIQTLIRSFTEARDAIRQQKGDRPFLEKKETLFLVAENFLKKNIEKINASQSHPLFIELLPDIPNDRLILTFHPDVLKACTSDKNKERLEQLLVNEIARITQLSSEELIATSQEISIPLHRLPNTSGYLVLDQKKLAQRYVRHLQSFVKQYWNPTHPDLATLPIVDFETYKALPKEKKALCLVVTSPLLFQGEIEGLKNNSIYIVAKGIGQIAKAYESFPSSQLSLDFQSDLKRLAEMCNRDAFFAYFGSSLTQTLAEDGDLCFEKPNFSHQLLLASREEFTVRANGELAVLELADREHRLLVENAIETQMHEDLLKWKDDYQTAQVSLTPTVRYDVPKPTKSVLLQNILLSARKYIRGDERKIIRWGLDLSGGKSVQIELLNANRQPITQEEEIRQGINELYNRVNKMGVSEVSIRQVGHHVVLDFPGMQALSASELIKASTMYFHVVNEKFSSSNPALSNSVNRFLQEVWNEASVVGKKDPQTLQEIAYRHLHTEQGDIRSVAAEELWGNGLRLTSSLDADGSTALDDSISKIAMFKGNDPSTWQGQNHPLMIVFRNWALDGASLENVHTSYDPSKGNFLHFDVRAPYEFSGKKITPRKDLYSWTSHYARENVQGTSLENETRGRGWRMAVILNDTIVSAPSLESALKDSAMISGSFSQREAHLLESDLKAGSLSFTPRILSEKNISPELGATDRVKGITATAIALLLIVGSMILFYRFAGFVASLAVILNLFILWATLQNLGATLTLAGLAAIVLTIGMAIDANVLVFERVKEEFALSHNIRFALSTGYQKAFSAILDSNITTIIAALILLNFDAGPIKSFAINLLIGIVSSMFTALFVTRFYFLGWAEKYKGATLKMAHWFQTSTYNFLKISKVIFPFAMAMIVSGLFLVASHRDRIFGMDFTGGHSVHIVLEPMGDAHYREQVEAAFLSQGAALSDFQVRELDQPHHLRLLFSKNALGSISETEKSQWIQDALQQCGISLSTHSQNALASSWTSISGQMSDSMRNHALVGLGLSLFCIFVYLSVRFEYKFAASALICLVHDVLATIGLIGYLHVSGLNVQIDLNTIAALMTIIGYSLNDTIIIFDRIREEMKKGHRKKISEIVNLAVNATLSRTAITSGTTLLVLIALLLFGGASIFGFASVMTLGVVVGTLSSWFIATPLLIFFHRREEKKGQAFATIGME